MPKIAQHYLDCSVYLYDSQQAAEAGENFGGSGCLIQVESDPHTKRAADGRPTKDVVYFPPHLYAVTNAHVVRGFPVIRLNTVDDTIDVLNLSVNDWICHPNGDDLAVAPIQLPTSKHNYFPLNSAYFVHRDDMERGTIGAGDDTFMVGRFITHGGRQRNTPSLRFGSIAMLPFDNVKLESGHSQEAFLVETRSISGYSGSPVFVYRPKETRVAAPPRDRFDLRSNWGGESRYTAITDLVGIPELLGIDCGHIQKYEKVVDRIGNPHPQGWKVSSNTGMAIVIPAWRLVDLFNKPELIMQRKEKDDEYLREREHEEVVVSDSEKSDEFTRGSYEDALRRASSRVSEPESEKKQTSD